MTSDKIRKDKNQNIQVFIRLRPLNQREKDIKSLGVVEVVNNREVVVRQSQQTSHTKKFTFDRAFGPVTTQLHVYQEVVSPLIEEVLAGYNCTVFAYGQTGTGKTHTMVGEHSGTETTWQNDPLAGIIPRALSQIFDELRLTNTEYTVRVSYLELYNEELFDLLSSSEDNSKLRIYEDASRKGSNIVHGLEEITVHNKNEVYKIMAQGQEKKRVASTLMNAQSSNLPNEQCMFRSHTVFTILIHMKENSPEGEELMKIGKLNLVDLAGSENISKAGSDNPAKKERARECVNINQSLLTLGRVITALVEKHPHIPYRESKLTRILQESLGGRTKTSIIATISPGHKDLEETMSTLEYAHRAKNIQNKPEINQKMTKKAMLKEYVEEIDRLKRDLQAARDKNGVYLASETFAEMTLKQEEQHKEIQELLLKKRAMEEEKSRMESLFEELNNSLGSKNQELASTKNLLNNTKVELASTSNMLVKTKEECEERQHLVQTHQETEKELSAQAKQLLGTADVATTHVACLHETVDKRKSVESTNLEVTRTYREQSSQKRDSICTGVREFTHGITGTLHTLQSATDNFNTTNTQTLEQNKEKLEHVKQSLVDTVTQIKTVTSQSHDEFVEAVSSHRTALHSSVSEHCSALQSALAAFRQNFATSVQNVQNVDVKGNVAAFVQQWYSGASGRVASLQRAHAAHVARARAALAARAGRDAAHRGRRRTRLQARAHQMQAYITEVSEGSQQFEALLESRLRRMDQDQKNLEEKLIRQAEVERKALEERLARQAEIEREALEQRLAREVEMIEQEKRILEERMTRFKEWHQKLMETNEEELAEAEADLEESDNLREQDCQSCKTFDNEFEQGSNAIGVDMEVFSKNVVEVVEHVNEDMLKVLTQTGDSVEQQVQSVVQADTASRGQFAREMDATLASLVDSTKQMVAQVDNAIETKHSTEVANISTIAQTTDELVTLSRSHHASHTVSSETGIQLAASFEARQSEAMSNLAELEARYLTQEYRVYSPTGKTPTRVEYQYPRMLAATSPHERILARFRAMRQHSDEDDCIVVENDTDTQPGEDSECSTSDDSTVFAVPSPPIVHKRSTPNIVKSTSESDIYSYRKQEQGKENATRSVSHKRSKLPAPSSHKKPLVERNASVN